MLTESDKFGQRGAVPMRLPGKRISVVTDNRIADTWHTSLAHSGVELIIA